MYFTDLPFDISEEKQSHRSLSRKKKILGLGINDIWLGIQPRSGACIDRINLRLINRQEIKFWRWDNAPQDKIILVGVSPYDPIATPLQERRMRLHLASKPKSSDFLIEDTWFEKMDDSVGGYHIEFNPPYQRSKDEFLWLHIKVLAQRPWKGHISFQGRRGTEARSYARLPIEFIRQQSAN